MKKSTTKSMTIDAIFNYYDTDNNIVDTRTELIGLAHFSEDEMPDEIVIGDFVFKFDKYLK